MLTNWFVIDKCSEITFAWLTTGSLFFITTAVVTETAVHVGLQVVRVLSSCREPFSPVRRQTYGDLPTSEHHRPYTSTRLYRLAAEARVREWLAQAVLGNAEGETGTRDLSITRPTLYHWTTELLQLCRASETKYCIYLMSQG